MVVCSLLVFFFQMYISDIIMHYDLRMSWGLSVPFSAIKKLFIIIIRPFLSLPSRSSEPLRPPPPLLISTASIPQICLAS